MARITRGPNYLALPYHGPDVLVMWSTGKNSSFDLVTQGLFQKISRGGGGWQNRTYVERKFGGHWIVWVISGGGGGGGGGGLGLKSLSPPPPPPPPPQKKKKSCLVDINIHSCPGSIPPWVSGRLLRNGPGMFEVGNTKHSHWFDGLALLHSFTIANG